MKIANELKLISNQLKNLILTSQEQGIMITLLSDMVIDHGIISREDLSKKFKRQWNNFKGYLEARHSAIVKNGKPFTADEESKFKQSYDNVHAELIKANQESFRQCK